MAIIYRSNDQLAVSKLLNIKIYRDHLGMCAFQDSCNAILDDPDTFEEDKVDRLEELVRSKYPSSTPDQIEKTIMDIMWRHKDPSKRPNKPQIVKVEDVVSKADIPSFERRLKLEKQFLELESLNERARHNKSTYQKPTSEQAKLESEYQDLLRKTEDLKMEIYGNKAVASDPIKISPIDRILKMFGGTVSRQRVEQALKSTGYNVIDASTLILNQIKKFEQGDRPEANNTGVINKPDRFFNADSKRKVVCSFYAKNGHCLRSDCKFSHNVEDSVCSFWLKGNCLAGDSCMFKHNLDEFDTPTAPSTADSVDTNSGLFNSVSSTTSSVTIPKFDFKSIPSFVPSSPAGVVSSPGISASPIQITKPIKKPVAVPWENPSDPHLRKYLAHRNSAIKFENNRKRYAQKSTDAWKTNNGEKAKKMSEKANEFEDKSFDELKLADDELYEYSEAQKDEAWFEMHGLEFNDAIDQLNTNLEEVRTKYPRNSKTVYLVVPSTSNYSDYKKITKPLSIWLDHEGFRWQIFNYSTPQFGSILALDPWPL